jgi:type I restriction-modification system DNA methylase subunit
MSIKNGFAMAIGAFFVSSAAIANTSAASITYYVNENIKEGVSITSMDVGLNNVFLLYQPKYFGNSTALSLSYQDSESNDTLTFSLAYYFDTKVSLKDRARRY